MESMQSGIAFTADGRGQQQGLNPKHSVILQGRGIDPEFAVKLGWRSSTKNTGGEEWIAIPYVADGRIINHKYRTIAGEKKFYQDAKAEKNFYNADAIKAAGCEPIIITEGEMDCVIALQCGYLAVSVPDGAPATKITDEDSPKYEYLKHLSGLREIILCVDGDEAGANLLHDLSIRIGKHFCKWVKYPKGCKDLNEVFLAHGKQGVDEVIRSAEFLKIDGVYRLSELPPYIAKPPHRTGVEGLDPHMNLRLADFSVVTGIPSHGKSTFVNEVACNMVMLHGWKVAFASFEQNPQVDHTRSLRTYYHQKPEYLQTPDQKAEADKWLEKNFTFIIGNDDSDELITLGWCLEKCAAAVVQHGVKLVIIDPWNEMDHDFKQNEMSLTQYTGFAIKRFKQFARRYQVHVMIVAHPVKMPKNKDGVHVMPSLYEISDSSHWYNKADLGIIVHRLEDSNTLIRIAKSRYHGIIGKPGDIVVKFDDYRNRFTLVEAA